ncbi:putative D,D-dipeptide-binding periplasmic protein DdpA [Methylobacterium frigidaeris]|uniref:D,D-dipeptide-binding periplasmic protein DdpA n=2 Tax=Methylobacterium frigidaeris TaxID=2038277 RepID=A0AA37HGY5_9HYPH|nr:putative D,D-dipeptide-binding periplasmic protein DdpA [Methylobacterium frigidaeris]
MGVTKTSMRMGGLAGALIVALAVGAAPALAQSRAETLRYVTGASVNTLDPTMPGTTREAFAISLSTYDRLVTFGRKKLGDNWVFDLDTIRGELAERYEVSPDGLTLTFYLRKDAKFQDGTPVTADDVKWSLDRAVSAKSLAGPQLLTGSLTSPGQFTVVDPHTFKVTLPKPDRLALPNLATVYAIVINSKAAKAHATPEDPWAQSWLKDHAVGSGAYSVDVFKPGEQVVLKRNADWTGAAPDKPAGFKRVIAQTIPDPATRANLVEKGDADIVIDLQANDALALKERGKLKVIATPQFNAVTLISFNTKMPPFDKVEVRQALAYALPYDAMFKAALFGRGKPLFGATWGEGDPQPVFPVAQPVTLDLPKAKTLLAKAGLPDGFSTTFSFNVGQAATAEPMAALIRESLEKIGVKVEIQKLPDAQMSTQVSEKKLPFFTEGIVAWLPSPDYFYRNFYTGNQRWNYSSIDDPEINEIAAKARFERDPAKYDDDARALNRRNFALMPQIPIWQPNQDAVMAQSVEGYTYQFHRQVDYRDLSRKAAEK